jgi:hypothetical protein
MCTLLNQELAVVGLINAIAIAESRDEDLCSFLSDKEVDITPGDVMNYCNYLSYADYGPILRNFDTNTLEMLFESKLNFFRKKENNKYTIVMEGYKDVLSSCEPDKYFKELRKVLIKEFLPDLNYPRSFLKLMRLCD